MFGRFVAAFLEGGSRTLPFRCFLPSGSGVLWLSFLLIFLFFSSLPTICSHSGLGLHLCVGVCIRFMCGYGVCGLGPCCP